MFSTMPLSFLPTQNTVQVAVPVDCHMPWAPPSGRLPYCRLFVSKSTTPNADTCVVGQKVVHKCPVQTFVLLLIGSPGIASGEARPPGDNGYHFVFMPSHLFPAYPSYRWGAIVGDRCEDSACLHSSTICDAPVVFLHGWLLMHGSCHA